MIFLLSSESKNCDKMGESGFCEIVCSVMRSCAEAPPTAADQDEAMVNCLKAMKFLCDVPANQYR